MPSFAANLTTMFTEYPFIDRFAAAAEAGFRGVEYLFPYEHEPEDLARELRAHGLEQALFNAPAGRWDQGERGLATLEGRDDEFVESIERALLYARVLDCPRIHVMAGNAPRSAENRARYVDRVRYAADEAAKVGREVAIEPINGRDMPDYFLGSIHQGVDSLEQIDRENVGLQFDIYHAQIMHGDVTMLLRSCIDHITHVQIASVPDRNEPDRGELNYRYVLDQLLAAGYDGWIGCEYFPRATTAVGLAWMTPFLRS